MLVTNTNCWVHFCKLSFWQIITWPIDSRQPDSPSFFQKFQSFRVYIFSYTRQTKIPDFTVFFMLSLHLYMTQEVTILQTQFKTRVVSFWGAISPSYLPRVRVRATVKLSAAFFHIESSVTKGGYESAIAPFLVMLCSMVNVYKYAYLQIPAYQYGGQQKWRNLFPRRGNSL